MNAIRHEKRIRPRFSFISNAFSLIDCAFSTAKSILYEYHKSWRRVSASERAKETERKTKAKPSFQTSSFVFCFCCFFYFSSWWLSSFLMKFCFHLSLYELTRFVFRLVHWAFTLMWSKSQPFHLYIVYGMFGTTSILLKIARFRVCALQYIQCSHMWHGNRIQSMLTAQAEYMHSDVCIQFRTSTP